MIGMTLALAAVVTAWFLFSFRLGGGSGGASYAFDLSRIASTPAAVMKHARSVLLEYAIRLPIWQFGLPNLPTKLDTLVGAIAIPAFTILGMVRLARTWPIAVVNLVLGVGMLLVWPWIDVRFLAPLVPSIVPMMLIGIAAGSRQWAGVRAERVAIATAIVFGLSAVGTGLRAATNGLNCRANASSLSDPACNHAETRAIAPASRFLRDSVPGDPIVATQKNALVYYISGHRTVRPSKRTQDGQLAFLTPTSGVDYLILTTRGTGVDQAMLADLVTACDSLQVVREFAFGTFLIRRRPTGDDSGPACDAMARIQTLIATSPDRR